MNNTMLYALIAVLALVVAGLAYRWLFCARKSALYQDYIDAGRSAARRSGIRLARRHPWGEAAPRGRDLR